MSKHFAIIEQAAQSAGTRAADGFAVFQNPTNEPLKTGIVPQGQTLGAQASLSRYLAMMKREFSTSKLMKAGIVPHDERLGEA